METTALHSLAASQAVIAWIFIIIGALATGFALFFLLIIKYSFFKGLALVLLSSGILQICQGSCMLATCNGAHVVLHTKGTLTDGKDAYIREQIQHAGNFTWITIAAFAIGALLFITFFRSAQTFWKGIGLGMMIQAALSATVFKAEIVELKRGKATLTQGLAFQTKCRKKIEAHWNWYSDFS